ncbi:MAG: glycerophosphodiester phosphodiesterase [Chloroflexi bacterium]|nr:glycerophosphodiester phosphodiesterase [Chloroflexota bacterium]
MAGRPDNALPRVIAHRGASAEAPENTLAAFALAAEQGADMVELDVQASRDGQLVVIHDATVDRTTNGSGAVRGYSLAELRQLDAGGWFASRYTAERIPTLGDVCRFASGRIALNLEVKCQPGEFAPLAGSFLSELAAHDHLNSALISAFSLPVLVELRRLSPVVQLAYLFAGAWPGGEQYERLALAALHPKHSLVDAPRVSEAHARGLAVNVWTVDERARWGELVALAVDGVVTNKPAGLLAYLLSGSR